MSKKIGKYNFYTVEDSYDDYKKELSTYGIEIQVDFKLYKKIINAYISLMKIFLVNGLKIQFPRFTGKFYLNYIKRNYTKKNGQMKLSINWGESNKQKEEILARGGTLYEEWWEKDGEKLIEYADGFRKANNGGEEWLVYYNDDGYYKFIWLRGYLLGDKRGKWWHLVGYTFKVARDFRIEGVKQAKQLPSYMFKGNENNINEITIIRCIQNFRDSRRKLDA